MSDAEVTGDADSVAQFVADLRKLRLAAGSPTLARLQHDTGISRTVLSEAFSGRHLPSTRTVDGIARACGGDPAAWIDRRDALAQARRAAAAPAEGQGTVDTGEEPAAAGPEQAPSIPRRTAGWLMAAAFLIGAAVSGATAAVVATQILSVQAAGAANGAPQIEVASGEDPALTECLDDARVVSGDTRADNSLLEVVWSDKCQAGWGRITRYDGLAMGNTVTIAIYPQTAPHGPDRQEATEHDVQGAYTALVVRPSPETLLCAEGSLTIDGTRIDLGDPLCV
ncbi:MULTISPECIES: DUF2690 domain-containing protein [Microbacterium]|uniref:DUF2690 domain-containing protein n=1 Tax=Microbacterium wangchenii TaxID=2541726 RepID=A0ABX5SNN4_9MICO|nr:MULTISPECIES: DUF2690 domain-containing protein [Microbacterium]MCK6068129.1 DUF2690 domain-containing protein [Microbacterium sp. EYE_512]QBR87750.1 DUF2690 domain-containing protein [Microbacterium wangchenii]